MARRQTDIQRQINNNYGARRNMNGAGEGGRLVAQRSRNGRVGSAGKSQLGSRSQRSYDIRAAFASTLGITAG